MTATAGHGRDRATAHRLPASIVTLAALLALLAVGAFQGGLAMVTDPLEPLGMALSYLEATPIDDYFLAGVFLLAVAGVSLITSAGLIFRWEWSWAAPIERLLGTRWQGIGAIGIGLVLLAFETIELFLVPFHPVMHPLLIAWSAVIVALPFTRGARAALRCR